MSARNDPEFADVVDGVLASAAAAVSSLIEIQGSPEHRLVLAHAVVGISEGISRHALTDPDGPTTPTSLRTGLPSLHGLVCEACDQKPDIVCGRDSRVVLPGNCDDPRRGAPWPGPVPISTNARRRSRTTVIDLHRALVSLQEELEAVDWYHQRSVDEQP